jgi:hypothetical protein
MTGHLAGQVFSKAEFRLAVAQTGVLVSEGRKCTIFQWGLTDTLCRSTVLLCIRSFETTAKQTGSATKAVAVSSAELPLVTAQTVASGRGIGGRIFSE